MKPSAVAESLLLVTALISSTGAANQPTSPGKLESAGGNQLQSLTRKGASNDLNFDAHRTQIPAMAQDFSIRAWQMEDGLPQNAITAIQQTVEGYIWAGTYGGLARFDGVRFKVFDSGNTPELQNGRITTLYEQNDGTLWIGHETGDVTRFQNGQFRTLLIPEKTPREKIIYIATDSSAQTWILDQRGHLHRSQDGLMLTPETRGRPLNFYTALAVSKQGEFWVLRNGTVSNLTGNQLQIVEFGDAVVPGSVLAIAAGRDKGFWIISDQAILKWHGSGWIEKRVRPSWSRNSITMVLELANGCLAVGTLDEGLYLVSPNANVVHLNRDNGLTHDWVRSLFEDREGTLWAGVGRSGLLAIRPARVATIHPSDRWQGRALLSVTATKDESLWIGTEGAGLYRFKNGNWSHFDRNERLFNPFVWSLAEDGQGRLMAGTWGGGLHLLQGERFERIPGLERIYTPIPALFAAPDGILWLGTGAGLCRYENGITNWYGTAEGLVSPDVRAITQDREGAIWFGMFGGGLGRLKKGKLDQFRKHDGLASDFVQCLYSDFDGTLWVGTADGGLSRYKEGKFTNINTRQGLPNNVICHIADDNFGYLWMSTRGGIVRIQKEELNRCAEGKNSIMKCLIYGQSDGLPTLDFSGGLQPAGCKMTDGRLCFTSSKGLIVVDPGHIQTNVLSPPVVIEELSVDGRALRPSPHMEIPPGRQRFEIRYAGLSFAAPEKVLFRYKLEGLEDDWVDAEKKRSASYSYLPPGRYTFRVKACNNDGVWNDQGTSLAFTVLPFFWQTWWFRGLAGVSFASLTGIGALYMTRRRMRQQLDRAERQQAVERERARIAQDIHDDLGASLTRITLLSQSAKADLENQSQATADLDRIYGTAQELTRALDEIVWAVNPKHDTLDSLVNYLGGFAQDFLGAAKLRCRLDFPVQLPQWSLSAETRHNLFLAFKESMHNAIKHSGASEVHVSMVLESAAFALIIQDNGSGFTAPEHQAYRWQNDTAPQRNGMVNLHQRLFDIGGHCKVESQPDKGTKITLWVPIRPENAFKRIDDQPSSPKRIQRTS